MTQSTVAKVQAAARSRSSGATRLVQNSFSATAGLVLDPDVRLFKGLAVSGSGTQPRSASLVSRSGQASSKQATAFLLPPCPKASGATARTGKAKPGRALARRSQSRLVEVRGLLSGETWIRQEFSLTDHVLCVKECVQRAREVPPWQQKLVYQGQILEDQTKLSDLDMPTHEVVFELVRRLSPTSEDRGALSAARTALDEKAQLLDALEPKRLVRISRFDHPSESLAVASVAALHMLSGSLACTRAGATWSSCRFMWADKEFVKQLRLLPDKIENGSLTAWADRVQACRATINSLPGGEDDVGKLDYLRSLGRSSWGRYGECEKLVEYLMAVLKYYDEIVQFREGFSGAAMDELLKES